MDKDLIQRDVAIIVKTERNVKMGNRGIIYYRFPTFRLYDTRILTHF